MNLKLRLYFVTKNDDKELSCQVVRKLVEYCYLGKVSVPVGRMFTKGNPFIYKVKTNYCRHTTLTLS